MDLLRPYAQHHGQQQFFQRDDFVVLFHDPRMLIVKLEARFYQATIVVAHAPYSSHSEIERASWWDHAETLLLRFHPNVLLIDASGRVGNIHTSAIGGARWTQEEDYHGTRFHRLLAQLQLCAPATLLPTDLPTYTWVPCNSQCANKHRIDYVCLDQQALAWVTHHRVIYDLDPLTHEDHYAVVLDLEMSAVQYRTSRRRLPAIDRNKFANLSLQQEFNWKAQALPIPPWHVPVDLHSQTTISAIRQLAIEVFGSRCKAQKRQRFPCFLLWVIRLRRKSQSLAAAVACTRCFRCLLAGLGYCS